MKYSKILATGGYLPEKVLRNTDLETMVATSAEWIWERTGIEERHLAAPQETTCDLAEKAARRALLAAAVEPAAIDLIIVATTTPDYIFPSVASQLQERLGNYGCAAFDIQAVCTGFIYALGIADQFIRAGGSRRALVVGAETFSRIVNWQDRSTCILFGDGAGVSSGYEITRQNAAYVAMSGSEVFKFAVNTLSRIAQEILGDNRMTITDIDWLVPHQANERILVATARKLHLPLERVINTVRTHANTSAASVPLALDVAVRDGRIQRGDTVLLEAFGGGFTWGAVLLNY